jgi:hypothetical protein
LHIFLFDYLYSVVKTRGILKRWPLNLVLSQAYYFYNYFSYVYYQNFGLAVFSRSTRLPIYHKNPYIY